MILLKYLRVHALKQLHNVELWFPRRGSVLVEGHNEAGKSTLFEAVYFGLYGSPLVGEETRATFDDLIPHDGTRAAVTLIVVVNDTELEVRRVLQIRQGRKATQDAQLIVRRPGAPVEVLHGPRAVNDRIYQEMNGLDGDALRNSCFMEQKALDRVEMLTRAQRELAVARLLGLERLKAVEDDLRATATELRRLAERKSSELEVAHARREANSANTRLERAIEVERAARTSVVMSERDAAHARHRSHATTTDDLARRKMDLTRQADLAAHAHAVLDAASSATATLRTATEKHALALTYREALAELDQIERVELPSQRDRVERLALLESRLTELEMMRARRERAHEVDALRSDIESARSALDQANAALAQAQETLTQTEIRALLMRWIERKTPVEQRLMVDERTEAIKAEVAEARKRELHVASIRKRLQIALTLASLVLLVALGGAVLMHVLWLVAALAAIVAVALGIATGRAYVDATRAAQAFQLIREKQMQLDAEQAAAKTLGQKLVDVTDIEADLRRSQVSPPDSIDAARSMLAQLSLSPTIDSSAAHAEVEDKAQRVSAARVALLAAEQRLAQVGVEGMETPATTEHDIVALERAIVTESEALGCPPDAGSLAAARGSASARVELLQVRLAGKNTLSHQIAELERAEHALIEQAAGILRACADDAVLTGIVLLAGDMASLDALLDSARRYHDDAAACLAAIDEHEVRDQLARLDERERTTALSSADVHAEYDMLCERVRQLLAEQGIGYSGEVARATLAEAWPAFAGAQDLPLDSAQSELEDARVRAYHLQQQARELAARYSLEDRDLDEDDCKRSWQAIDRDVKRHEAATQMAQEVRTRIVRRVMPETAAHMRALLPQLTAGRYRDVQLNGEDDDGADLRIRVWDMTAGRYVAKNLFSGGTRDQASLALRLAFALATLPKERGATPGFIFLDEPLSSFDDERTRALVDVLTQGEIARHFAQVVLISHNRSFDHNQFTYRVRLVDGRIDESTLPAEREAVELWSAESAVSGPLP